MNPYPLEREPNELLVSWRAPLPSLCRSARFLVSRRRTSGMCSASNERSEATMYIGGGILTILLIILLIYLLA